MSVDKIIKECVKFRKKRGITQVKVSIELGYSPENISAFENGRNNNMIILVWYLCNVVPRTNLVEVILGGVTNDN